MIKKVCVLLSVLLMFCCFFTIISCSNENEGGTVIVTDMLGFKVEVVKKPKKVACVSRTTYDLLIAFGLEDIIDGAYYSLLENEWAEILCPESSDHYSYQYNESYETFITRGVDLVFAPENYIAEGLKEHGITALNVSLYGNPSFDSYIFYFADLVEQLWGEIDGVTKKVNAWKAQFNKAVSDIQIELAKHDDVKKSIYYVRGDKNNGIGYTDTGKSFVEYAYKTLGLTYTGNSFGTNKPSAEAICEKNPDIFVIGGIYQKTLINQLMTSEPYTNLDAVNNNMVYNIPIGLTMFEQLSVYSPVFLCDQANKIYPDHFNFNIVQMVKDITNEYFSITLTDTDVYNMLNGLNRHGQPLA